MPIKVLLADDTELIRRAIRRILSGHPEIELVGEAQDFAQVIQMKSELQPEVIVMDLYMPNENNIPVERLKQELNEESKLVAISVWVDEDAKSLAQRLGAFKLLDKMDVGHNLIPTIFDSVGHQGSSAALA